MRISSVEERIALDNLARLVLFWTFGRLLGHRVWYFSSGGELIEIRLQPNRTEVLNAWTSASWRLAVGSGTIIL